MDMAEKTVMYQRHGETEALANNIRSPKHTVLTQRGIEQVRTSARKLAKTWFPELVVCSQLPRAMNSAMVAAREFDYLPRLIVVNEKLNEREWGAAAGVDNDTIMKLYGDDPDRFDRIPGAETAEALRQRAAAALSDVMSFDADNILVVGHGTIGREIFAIATGVEYGEVDLGSESGAINNGQIVQLHPVATV
jgi:broad specificity phosphatase PhoE